MARKTLLEGKRILIVDDEPDVLDTLEELLPICNIVTASSFDEAKELLQSLQFDMAILDIMGVNGFELLEIANKRKILAIMLTAHALSPDSILRSYQEGAASYVPKEEMANIEIFLNDILEAKGKGKNLWWRWLERFDSYFKKLLGPPWRDSDIEFWKKLDSG